MSQTIISFFSFLPSDLQVFVISAIPIVELRGAIPWGIFIHRMPYIKTFLLAWVGSVLPAPFILWLMPAILDWMRGTTLFGPLANWLHDRGMRKSKDIAKYEIWGLTIFIAIPLPGTGVWTGCLAASLMDMDFKHGIFSAILGAAIAGVVVSLLCYFGLMAIGG